MAHAAGGFNPSNTSTYCKDGTGSIDKQQLTVSCQPDISPGSHPDIVSGFDIGLGVALASTAVLVARRSPFAEVTATVTATLLVCDAWFDVLTSRGVSDVAQALADALLVELPLAALCFWMARNIAHAIEVARPYLEAAGFTVANNRLQPPPEHTPAEAPN